jgi:hypothetical protein
MSAFLNELTDADRRRITQIAIAVYRRGEFPLIAIRAAYAFDRLSGSRLTELVAAQMTHYEDQLPLLRRLGFSDPDFRVELKAGEWFAGELALQVAVQVVTRAILDIVNINPSHGREDGAVWTFLGRMPRNFEFMPLTDNELRAPADPGVNSVDLWVDSEGWNAIARFGSAPGDYIAGCRYEPSGPHIREVFRRADLERALHAA